jgi:hypothetical protein
MIAANSEASRVPAAPPFAATGLAHCLGVLLGLLLLHGLAWRRRGIERHVVAAHLVETELLQALGEVLRQFGLDVIPTAPCPDQSFDPPSFQVICR